MKRLYVSLIAIFVLFNASPTKAQGGDDILNSIPSSLEVSTLIKDMGSSYYDRGSLSKTEAVGDYTTTYKQALNLGIYSTDLGMASLYKKNQDVLDYLNVVQRLAKSLSIQDFFDINELRTLAKEDDPKKLLTETTRNFSEINNHLQSKQRGYVSTLLITGGWIEATYLTTKVYDKSKNTQLKEKIGEQKLVLERLLQGLSAYKTKPGFDGLIKDLKALEAVYRSVTISSNGGTTKVVEKDGELVVESTGKTTVEVSDATISRIQSLLGSIRSKIVQ